MIKAAIFVRSSNSKHIMSTGFTSTTNSIAHGALKAGRVDSWKDACKVAERNRNIVEMLDAGCVRFVFEKEDGTQREAWGTRNNEIILERGGKELKPIEHTAKAVVYFDLDANAVRSFVPARMRFTEAPTV